jgi:TetR/AcrR family transcriptional repressor of nem operon
MGKSEEHMTDKRRQIIEIVANIVHSKGYEGTSIQDIMQAAQIGKGQFYHYFSSKQELGLEIVDYCFAQWHQRVIEGILESKNDPKVKINLMLECAVDIHQNNGGKCGCFFGNLAVELSEHNDVFRRRLNKVFELWIDHLKVLLDEIMEQEDLPVQTDSQTLAQAIVAMIEGGILLMKNRQDVQTLANVAQVIKKMINS